MTDPAPPALSSSVTRRGLEITSPTPNTVVGCLVPLMLLLGFVALVLFATSDLFVEGTDAWTRVFDELFGWWWIGLGAVAVAMVFAFSHRSNQHVILGTRRVRYQHRIGRVVMHEQDAPLTSIAEVEAVPRSGDEWIVQWRGRRHWSVVGTADRETAEAVAARIRTWIAEPGALPLEAGGPPAPVVAAETVLSLVTSRLTLVLPLAVAMGALLLLASVWQLSEARLGRTAPLPAYDRVAEGELTSYRWYVHTPFDDSRDASLHLRASIRYVPEDGVERTLWLRTRPAVDLYLTRPGHAQRAVTSLAVPAVEFELPRWTAAALETPGSWNAWRALASLRASTGDDEYHRANLLSRLDDPFHYLVALWSAPAPDWRVAYSAAAPERAMPLAWVEAERRALRAVPLEALYLLGGAAALALLLGVPRLVTGRSRRWAGRAAALVLVASVPLWAQHAERVARAAGFGDWLNDAVAGALRLGLADSLASHAVLVRSHPPATEGVALRWTPERSSAAALLRRLELLPAPEGLPVADSAAAVELMIRRAEAALGRLSDAELIGFVGEYEQGDWYARADGLHAAVLEPALCGLLGAQRPPEVRDALASLVYGPAERRRELCGPRAAAGAARARPG